MIGARLTSPATVLEAGGIQKPPDDLWVTSIPNGLQVIFGCGAWKWNVGIDQGEFRAMQVAAGSSYPDSVDLRTVSEGGTFAHNGTTQLIVTGLHADWSGCQYDIVSGSQGRWFFAFRLHNAAGWSVWSDGNDTPEKVKDYCDTEGTDVTSDGPPEDWSITVKQSTTQHAVIVSATRPAIHGTRIWGIVVQIKYSTSGSWVAIDGSSPASVLYDGSAIDHTISENGSRLTRNSGTGFDSAAVGKLILMDVRGGTFDHKYCQWGTVKAIGSNYVDVQGRFRPVTGVTNNIRIKIVEPPWGWTTGGYLGSSPNAGLWAAWYIGPDNNGDTISQVFTSDPIEVPADVNLADIQARIWYDNGYSRSDDGNYGTGDVSSGYCVVLADTSTIETDASLAGEPPIKQFRVSISGNRTLGNPTNALCGQLIRWCIVNTSSSEATVTLDDKFRVGKIIPELQRIYDNSGSGEFLPGRITEDDSYDPDAVIQFWGDPAIDGSWRMLRDGNDLIIQRRESGDWSTKDTFTSDIAQNIGDPGADGSWRLAQSGNDLLVQHLESSSWVTKQTYPDTFSTVVQYFGDSGTDGSWRIVRDSNNLVVQRRETGSWVTKQTFSP